MTEPQRLCLETLPAGLAAQCVRPGPFMTKEICV